MTGTTPAYVTIADRIGEQIRQGELPPGARVPGERDIRERYHVSANVARAVIARLRGQGLIISHQGKGSFVADRPEPIVSVRDGRDIRPSGDERLLTAHYSEVDAPQDVAKDLGISADDRVNLILYRWTVNGEIVETSEYYEPLTHPENPGVRPAASNGAEPDVISRFAGIGTTVTRIEEMTSARMPTPDETHMMNIPPGVPVLVVQRIHYADKVAVALTRTVFRADLIVLRSTPSLSTQK